MSLSVNQSSSANWAIKTDHQTAYPLRPQPRDDGGGRGFSSSPMRAVERLTEWLKSSTLATTIWWPKEVEALPILPITVVVSRIWGATVAQSDSLSLGKTTSSTWTPRALLAAFGWCRLPPSPFLPFGLVCVCGCSLAAWHTAAQQKPSPCVVCVPL